MKALLLYQHVIRANPMIPTNHPAPESEREAIARIIDEHAVDVVKMHGRTSASESSVRHNDAAFRKADAILSRMGGDDPVAWMHVWRDDGSLDGISFTKTEQHFQNVKTIPLYASPPAPALDARTVEASAPGCGETDCTFQDGWCKCGMEG